MSQGSGASLVDLLAVLDSVSVAVDIARLIEKDQINGARQYLFDVYPHISLCEANEIIEKIKIIIKEIEEAKNVG